MHKLEELKLQNLEKFIKLTRVEVEKYWDMMFYSEEDKKLFQPFYNENIGTVEIHILNSWREMHPQIAALSRTRGKHILKHFLVFDLPLSR